MSTFAGKVNKIMGDSVPGWIPRGVYEKNKKRYNHIFLNLNDNFIDGNYPEKCSVKGGLTDAEITYHTYAKHMNSSQVMCISFFKKFFEKPKYEYILLDILRNSGIEITPKDQIKAAAFEYEPCKKEGTNFDFYILLCSGKRISFETKYTEDSFGGPTNDKDDPQKYDKKWDGIYEDMIKTSPFLDTDKNEFYMNYQINRNILYANKNDYVIFLTPFANNAAKITAGRKYIKQMRNAHIKNLYWEKIVEETKTAVSNIPELKEYYAKFCDKYIRIFDLI